MLSTVQWGLGSSCERTSFYGLIKKWKFGNKTKVSDIQVSQGQQEESVDNMTKAIMTMVSPGVYGYYQFTAIQQQQMAYLKNQNRSQIFTHP